MLTRSRTRFDLIPRRVRVHAVHDLAPALRRPTFRDVAGADGPATLAGLQAPGPEDHVKVFLPDPATGELHAPWLAPDGGLQRPTGVVSISRDYTVRATRTVDGVRAHLGVRDEPFDLTRRGTGAEHHRDREQARGSDAGG